MSVVLILDSHELVNDPTYMVYLLVLMSVVLFTADVCNYHTQRDSLLLPAKTTGHLCLLMLNECVVGLMDDVVGEGNQRLFEFTQNDGFLLAVAADALNVRRGRTLLRWLNSTWLLVYIASDKGYLR